MRTSSVSASYGLTDDYLIRVTNAGVVNGNGPRGGAYNQRLVGAAAQRTETGYNVEIALAIGGLEKENGANFGLDIGINDMAANQNSRQNRIFWHRTNAADLTDVTTWGNAVLYGYNGTDTQKPDTYLMKEYIKRMTTTGTVPVNQYSFPRGAFPQGEKELDAAIAQAQAVIDSETATYIEANEATERLRNAILNLPNEGKYPNPKDLPVIDHMPNPFEFFDGTPVESKEDWEERREELIDLMSYYEFGEWPDAPENVSAEETGVFQGEENRFNIDIDVTDNGKTVTLPATITMPSGEGPFPVIVLTDFWRINAAILRIQGVSRRLHCRRFRADAHTI
jgi:hypothetical protein